MRFSESEIGFSGTSTYCAIEWSIALLLNAIVSDKITLFWKSRRFESDLRFYEESTRNSHAFLWQRSNLSKYFNSLCEVNEDWFYYENAVVPEKYHFILKVY